MANRAKRTQKKLADFLRALNERRGNVSAACKAVAIGRRTAYEWRDDDPEFAGRWDEIIEAALDEMEEEARRRAFEGVERPVFYQGVECGRFREYSDTLMIFLLKAGRPEKYRERFEVKNPDVKKIEVVYVEQTAGEDDPA